MRKILKNKKEDIFFRMVKANKVYPSDSYIQTSAGKLEYDILVVATGAKINFFNNEQISKHAFPLKQVTHALDLRSHIFQQFENLEAYPHEEDSSKYKTFVVTGAGPTGVEVCGALAELKRHVLPRDYPDLNIDEVKIYLIEGLPRVLPMMSEKSGNTAHKYLEKLGVKVILNHMIKDYDGEIVKLDNGEEIPSQTLIWAAGVKGNLIEGFEEGSIQKGKLIVNHINQVYRDFESKHFYDNIYAIGDVSMMASNEYPRGLPGLAQAAIQQGKHLASNLNRSEKGNSPIPFHYKNKGVLATIGRNKAVADLPNTRVDGFAGWFLWMVIHIMYLVGFRNKAVTFANWVWNYFTFDRGIRIILHPSTKKSDQISTEIVNAMDESEGSS
jgi:NADH dehydrogenase